MAKSRSHRKSILKSIRNTSQKALPVVGKGLKTVGTTAKYVAVKSAPVVEKGVSKVYETMAMGFDLGVKGTKNVIGKVRNMSNKRRYKKRGGKSRKH